MTAAKLTAADDALVLEDEKARMVLRGDGDALPLASLVTGVRDPDTKTLLSALLHDHQPCELRGSCGPAELTS